jgi:hypothetical protein
LKEKGFHKEAFLRFKALKFQAEPEHTFKEKRKTKKKQSHRLALEWIRSILKSMLEQGRITGSKQGFTEYCLTARAN